MRLSKTHFIVSVLASILWTGGLSCSFAQEPAPPAPGGPPPRPYVGALKGDFSLTKKYVYKAFKEEANQTPQQKDLQAFLSKFPIPMEMTSTETGTLRQDKRIYKSGLTVELWRTSSWRLSLYSNGGGSIDVTARVAGDNQDTPDFQELSWIDTESYQGLQTFQDKPCYVYKHDDQTAWIDKSTRLPILFETKGMQVTYTYRKPESPLELPPNFARRLQEVERPAGGASR